MLVSKARDKIADRVNRELVGRESGSEAGSKEEGGERSC